MDDQEIFGLYEARQEAAIAETKNKYGRRLFMISKNILHSNEDAEENVNDTLLKAWEAIPGVMPEKFGAYLAKIARNLALNKWEARSAAKRGGGQTDLLLSELEDAIPSSGSPETAYEATQTTEAINAFLTTEDQVTRAAFVLRYFHGENIAEISNRFKISESKTKSMLFRSRKKLKKHLEKEGVAI